MFREGEQTQINVNLFRVPPPDRSLVATVTAVALEGQTVSLIFGQRLPGADRMYGALNVTMAVRHVQKTVYASDEFLDSLADFAERNDITAEMRPASASVYPTTERIVTERASMASISFAEEEAEWRFFRVSPTDLRAANEGHTASVLYPVVQVIMDTAELVHLMHSIRSVVPREAT